MRTLALLAALAACGDPDPSWPLEGDVLSVDGTRVEVRHDAIEGLMPEMVMTFGAPEDAGLVPGDHIKARLSVGESGYTLSKIARLGTAIAVVRDDVEQIYVGQPWPATTTTAADGSPLIIGAGQGEPTVLAFLYTRCPNPEFCPALVGRLLSLQEQLPDSVRIVTVTLDPEHDTPQVLARYGSAVGADPAKWHFAHADNETIARLALYSGQDVLRVGNLVAHKHRLVVLDAEGVVIERYDHNMWAVVRVAKQLQTGSPVGLHPVNNSSPPPDPPR